jgi:hypothetical protein
MLLIKHFFPLLVFIPVISFSQKIKDRQYTKGETLTYRITTDVFRNNKFDGRTLAVSLHTVAEDNGLLAERIRWMLKTVYSDKDTINADSTARKVPAYSISLSPNGSLKIPPLTIPDMTGEITDLNTFYVAVSPALHVQKLSKSNPVFNDSILHGQFADGKQIISGEDRIEVIQKLIKQDKHISIVQTSFLPPSKLSITPLIDTIGKQSFDQPNNFQMVRKVAGDKVNLMWGVEQFTITTKLDNHTGKILEAKMVNTLTLRMRYNASADLLTYDGEIPLNIRREVVLELAR